MHFPKFWARGESGGVSCWRWSDSSLADAKDRAQAQARKIASSLSSNRQVLQRYGYSDRPLREEILEQVHSPGDTLAAAVTRNAYGCLVLNTSGAMFLDIDAENNNPPRVGIVGLIRRLFAGNASGAVDAAVETTKSKLESWLQLNPAWGLRLYQTAAGFRLLATHALFDPGKLGSERICDALAVDPLYRKLCETQQSFRARLTPKPWRIGLSACPVRWPWETREVEQKFKHWWESYNAKAERFATCRFIGSFGSTLAHPELAALVTMHDRASKAESGLPLA